MPFTSPSAPRLWRVFDDHSDEAFAAVAAEGFTGLWVFCELRDLMHSAVFPELNRPGTADRLARLQETITRAAGHGLDVYLYFNDPVSVDVDDPFWQNHPDLRGVEKWHSYALCTSTPQVQAFFREALESVFSRLTGVAGVLLITACESLTHCWSKSATRRGMPGPTCPRCRDREPADLVLELLQTWSEVSRAQPQPFRILAWNWEWAYWYPDPQAEIVSRLPEGVELLLGFEMGGARPWDGRTLYVGEYAFSYVGPGQQFLATRELVRRRGTPVHAKLEFNCTHELCSVPNVPVLQTLHSRFVSLLDLEVDGFLGCWSMGTRLTLNTAALRVFLQDPERYRDRTAFLSALARDYFGLADPAPIVRAWEQFSDAFTHYPFSVALLYHGPHNDAPARVLSLHYAGTPIGRSWQADPPGDDLAPCLQGFFSDGQSWTVAEVIAGFTRLRDGWAAGLRDYAALETLPVAQASKPASPLPVAPASRRYGAASLRDSGPLLHCRQELSVARMIAHQLTSIINVFRHYREQQRLLAEHHLTPPCDLPADPALLAIMADEIANLRQCLPLVEADPRLGWHQDIHGYKYNGEMIREKIATMEKELERAGS